MNHICVYLGSSFGNKECYKHSVEALGKEIAAQEYTLIYGGSSLGMMGVLANTAMKHGGKVIGITTQHLLDKEVPLDTLDELIIVDSMQERKKRMQTMADSFIVMPGGLGTLEEAIETWNAIKIGEITKPIAFFNKDAYFDSLFKFMTCCNESGFLKEADLKLPIVSDNIKVILNTLSINKTNKVSESATKACTV
ncbi:TIGR00730 family Rossman fold protein [Legionella sp. W05-934-2]|uniref:LOG family protein n=1 Tax=Legionella sp. W05-934-2 TaxID=1198649 RepID=UPI003461BB0E